MRSLAELKDDACYCNDCFFLPSPHTHSELESLEAAAKTIKIKAEEYGMSLSAPSALEIGSLVSARHSRQDKTFYPGKISAVAPSGDLMRYTVEWDEDESYTPNIPAAWIRERG